MDVEKLKVIADMISQLGEAGQAGFIWYLAVSLAQSIAACTATVLCAWLIPVGIGKGFRFMADH